MWLLLVRRLCGRTPSYERMWQLRQRRSQQRNENQPLWIEAAGLESVQRGVEKAHGLTSKSRNERVLEELLQEAVLMARGGTPDVTSACSNGDCEWWRRGLTPRYFPILSLVSGVAVPISSNLSRRVNAERPSSNGIAGLASLISLLYFLIIRIFVR